MVDRGIFIGANGAIAQQFGIDVLSHNIANINTVGFRAQRPTFGELFSRTDQIATTLTNPLQSGYGTDIRSTDTLFRQGTVKSSGAFSDVAITGDGFFVLKDPRLPASQQTFYTRAGNFSIDAGVATSGSGNPFTSGGQVVFLRDFPTYSTLPRLVDPDTGRVVQGYLADTDGVILTTTTDLTIDPSTKDKAKETKAYTVEGTLQSDTPDYDMSVMQDGSNAQLASLTGEFNKNSDRGLLTVKWNSDGSGTWQFLKVGQTLPDPQNTVTFSANTVQKNVTHSFIPGILFRTQDVTTLKSGSFTALVGPFDVKSNSSSVTSIEGAYLGNRGDGTLSVTTTGSGGVSWTFVPKGKTFISESGTGTFATADSATSAIVPGITLRKKAGSALTAGSLVVVTDHEADAGAAVGSMFDDDTPHTPHSLITTFKHIAQNEYGVMVSGQTQETFSDSAIATITGGQKRLTAYANIDQNQITVRRASDSAILPMASSKITADPGNNLLPASVRGAFWSSTSEISGNVSMTVAADGSGSYSFTPVGQTQPTVSGTIAAGTLRVNTTYGQPTGNEVIPGMIFTTGSALTAGTVTFESTIGSYNTFQNLITFSPSFSTKINSLSSFRADYKFASDLFTNASATSGTNLYTGDITFDQSGQFLASGSTVPDITFKPNSTFAALKVTPTLSGIQQFSGASDVNQASVDGNLEGILTSMQFSEQGTLLGNFSNGRNKNLAQLVLANFRNPGGLSRAGDTAFQETVSSGTATVQSIDQQGAGRARILPFKLEYSNATVEDELTDLLFFQRAFQFSSRAIRAADELVQNAIGLKRS